MALTAARDGSIPGPPRDHTASQSAKPPVASLASPRIEQFAAAAQRGQSRE